jgi:hypothetical protein
VYIVWFVLEDVALCGMLFGDTIKEADPERQ